MTRVVFLIVTANVLLLLGLLFLSTGILLMVIPLLMYAGVACLRTSSASSLNGRRQIGAEVITTENTTDITLTVENTGTAIDYMIIREAVAPYLDVIGGDVQATAALAAGASLTLSYEVAGRRGKMTLPDIEVSGGDTFNLFPWQSTLETNTKLTVVPAYPFVRRVAIRPLHTMGFTGPILSRQRGTGTDFFGVRQYEMGDPLRHVNWKATARYIDKPFTNEFEQDRIAEVGLILDARPQQLQVSGRESLLEVSVSATAGLADALLREGHRVGLFLYGLGHWVFPGYGRIQRERILRTLAETGMAASQSFGSLGQIPTRLFPPRSQLIIVSPLKDEDEQMLFRFRANGYSVIIVSPDPVTFEAKGITDDPMLPAAVRLARLERRLLLHRLRQTGIVIVDWQTEKSLDEALTAVLQRTAPIHHIREMKR